MTPHPFFSKKEPDNNSPERTNGYIKITDMNTPSHFSSFTDCNPRPTTWDDIYKRITSVNNDVCRLTTLCRQQKAAGNIKDAARTKASMGFYTPSVHMKGGRKESNITAFTLQCMCDFDHISRNHIRLLMQRVADSPHTRLAHITSSEEGIRIIYDWQAVTPDGEILPPDFFTYNPDSGESHHDFMMRCFPYHQRAWAQGNIYYQQLLDGAEIDEHCKDPNRISFYCHDIHAYINTTPQPIIIDPSTPLTQPSDSNTQDTVTTAQHDNTTSTPQQPVSTPQQPRQTQETDTQLTTLIERLLLQHPYRQGHRHGFWIALGQRMRFHHYSREQLNQCRQTALQILTLRNLMLPDDPATRKQGEVDDCLTWGYEHSNEATEKKEDEEETSDDDIIETQCPLFPDDIYTSLPRCLLDGLKPVLEYTWDDTLERATSVTFSSEQPRRRADALLMSLLTNYSTLCSNTHLIYGDRDYSPNIGFLCVAPAGNGKSIIEYGFRIIEATDRYLEKISADEHRAWEQNECKGDEPQPHLIAMPGTTSRSQFTICMNAMGNGGLIMNSTEINTLVSTLKLDVGNFIDLLCKAMMNEQIAQFFKVDNKPIKIQFPKLSICMSGTFSQFHSFIHSLEDGLYSRFLIIMMEQHTEWISQKPDSGRSNLAQHYKRLSNDALDMWLMLTDNPTWVTFTDEQWDDHTRQYTEHTAQIVAEGAADRASIVNRHGLAQMRIAAVLTAIRKWEAYKKQPFSQKTQGRNERQTDTRGNFADTHRIMQCTADDYRTASLITQCLLAQSLHLSTTMTNPPLRNVQPMKRWKWVELAVKEMPETFTSKQWVEKAQQHGVSVSQAYRSMRTLVKHAKMRKYTKNGITTYSRPGN